MAINGRQLRLETVSTELNYTWSDWSTGETHVEDMGVLTETLFRQVIEGEDFTVMWDRRLRYISSDFLNGSASVFAPRIAVAPDQLIENKDSEGRTYVTGTGMPDEMIYDYEVGTPTASSQWFNFGYGTRVHYYFSEHEDPTWQPGSWFIYGGSLGTDGVITSNLTASLPPDF